MSEVQMLGEWKYVNEKQCYDYLRAIARSLAMDGEEVFPLLSPPLLLPPSACGSG